MTNVNLGRNITIAQILLDLNILPHELNCLIIEYQKLIKGNLVQKIDLEKYINNIAVDSEYIYFVDNVKVSIYCKYDGVLVNDFLIRGVNGNQCIDSYLAIDNDHIYIGANSGQTYKIIVFDKNGKFIKDANINHRIYPLVVDNEYIYVANSDTIFKYTKKDFKLQIKSYQIRKSINISNISVDDKYVYSLNKKSTISNNFIMTMFDKNSTIIMFEKEKIEKSLFSQMGGKIYLYSNSDQSIKIMNIEKNKISKLHINNHGLPDFKENVKYFTIDNEFVYLVKNKNIQIYSL